VATTRFAFITTFSAPYMEFKNVEGHVMKEQTLNNRDIQKWGSKIVLQNARFLENQYGRQITSHTLLSTGTPAISALAFRGLLQSLQTKGDSVH